MFTGSLGLEKNPFINLEFEPDVPESILGQKPLYMLVQIFDSSHVRVGFRGKTTNPWYLSKVFDTVKSFGKIGLSWRPIRYIINGNALA
jgi:hypothetical protein